MLKGIIRFVKQLLPAAKPSTKTPRGRTQLQAEFLQRFGNRIVPETKKAIRQMEMNWKADPHGNWHLYLEYVDPEMRRAFTFLRPQRQDPLPRKEAPKPRPRPVSPVPAPKTPIRPKPSLPAKTPAITTPPPRKPSSRCMTARLARINSEGNATCPRCGTSNQSVGEPGIKKCPHCQMHYEAV